MGHSAEVVCIDVPPATGMAVSGAADGCVRVWDVGSGKCDGTIITTPHGGDNTAADVGVMSVACDSYGETVLTGEMNHAVRIFDLKSRSLISSFPGHTDAVFSVRISSANFLVGSASLDGTVRVWDVRNNAEPIFVMSDHSAPVFTINFDSTGSWLVSGGQDKIVRYASTKLNNARCSLLGFEAPGLSGTLISRDLSDAL